MRTSATFLLALVSLHASPAAFARQDLLAEVNAIRAQGCADHPGVKRELRRDPVLDRAARALASGERLRQAMKDAGYHATRSASLEVSGSDAAIAGALAQQGCKDIADPDFADVGVFERGDSGWIVLAGALVPPAASEAQAVSRRVLELDNEARANARRCGWKRLDPAPPLALSDTLQRAALAHARDMAEHSSLSHSGSGGSTPAERATRAGYQWRHVAENIASGQATPEQVVAEWLDSPRHCGNLMSPDYSEMGVAYAVERQSERGIYWAQLFAAPLPTS